MLSQTRQDELTLKIKQRIESGMYCNCRAKICKGRRWTCRGCKRFVPYCNGSHAGDSSDDLCDQCWKVNQ